MNWLEDCLETHVSCPYSDISKMPSRVVEIEKVNGILQVKLVVTAKDQVDRWVALSYCWGRDANFFQTTVANLESMLLGIEMSTLPLTYQHAFEVTSLLGYRYLCKLIVSSIYVQKRAHNDKGIDALCIVQDDTLDRTREIQAMHNIYRNAALTIAVDSASAADQGFLSGRSSSATESIFVPYKNRERDTCGRIGLRVPPQDRRENSALDERGWSLQENLLSPRTLRFGQDQLYWDCQSKYCSEGAPCDMLQVGWGRRQLKAYLLDDLRKELYDGVGRPILREDWLLHRWYRIINDYSKRKFTNEDDVFPAISAIAEEIQNQTGFRYRVGMWENDIHRGLLWKTSECRPESAHYRAPSWSWACIPPPIIYSKSKLEYYSWHENDWDISELRGNVEGDAKILDIHIASDDCNPNVFESPLPGSFISIEAAWTLVHDWVARSDFWFNASDFSMDPYDAGREIDLETIEGQIICDLDHSDYRQLFSDAHSEIGFLLIAQSPTGAYARNGETLLWCLIIQRRQPDEEDHFHRLGVARIPRGTEFPEPEWTTRTVKIF